MSMNGSKINSGLAIDVMIKKILHTGKRIFKLDLHFQTKSQRIVIQGPSGAGKSLSLKAIAGLMTPDAGKILLQGNTLFDADGKINLPPQQRNIGYLFQDYALFPHLNVRQNIAFGLTRGILNPTDNKSIPEVEHWLEVFGLQAVAHQLPDQLSGGQRQRTALARALAPQPQALLLDEPFAALDPDLRAAMRDELDRLQRRLEIPILVVTHDPEDARIFGDELLRLKDGSIAGV